jgi:WD40 repeat protein
MTTTTTTTTTTNSNASTTSSKNVVIRVHLPTEVLIGHVVPFLDRQSFSRFARTNKEMRLATQRLLITSKNNNNNTTNIPWPTHLVRKNHFSRIKCLAISPDNTTIMAGVSDGSIARWNIIQGEQASLQGGHWPGEAVVAIAHSKDGRWMASASTDHTIVLWRHQQIWKKIHAGHVTCLSFGPDDVLASGHSHGEAAIKLWNPSDGARIAEFRAGGDGRVETMRVSECGRRIRATADDGSIKSWNVSDGTYEFWVGSHKNAVGELLTNNNNNKNNNDSGGGLVIASVAHDDSHLVLWNRERRQHFQLLSPSASSTSTSTSSSRNGHSHPLEFAFSPNADRLASVDHSNSIKVWNVETGHLHRTMTMDEDHSFDSLTFSSDSKLLAAISRRQNRIRLMHT